MKTSNKLWLFFSALAILLAGTGITYAWFSHNAALTTLMEILPPDAIIIVPVSKDDSSEMYQLDLDFREGVDTEDENGYLHIRRYVCIQSTSPNHQLEVVHTTNLQSLNFEVFPAERVDENNASSELRPVSGAAALHGAYKNKKTDTGETLLAKPELLENYTAGDTVEAHAYPLYWLAYDSSHQSDIVSYETMKFDPAKQENRQFYYTYYCFEISWKEESKETDLFYVMAKNVEE